MPALQETFLQSLIRRIMWSDDGFAFCHPVNIRYLSQTIGPIYDDYPKIILHPMDLNTIYGKISRHQYLSVDDVTVDFHRIVQNASDWYWYCRGAKLKYKDPHIKDAAERLRKTYDEAVQTSRG